MRPKLFGEVQKKCKRNGWGSGFPTPEEYKRTVGVKCHKNMTAYWDMMTIAKFNEIFFSLAYRKFKKEMDV